jgi:hypothetical protein
LDAAAYQEIQSLVKSLIKIWWDNECVLQASINNANDFYRTQEVLRYCIKRLEDSAGELNVLKNSVTDYNLKSRILDYIKTWWEVEKSVYVQRDGRYYSKSEVLNTYANTVLDHRERLERLEKKPNITVNDIQTSIRQNIQNFVEQERYRYHLQRHEEKLTNLELKLNEVVCENNRLKGELETFKKQSTAQPIAQPLAQSPMSGINTRKNTVSCPSDHIIIEAFNDWARDPQSSMPSKFRYADGELKLREKQTINNTGNKNSLWILYESEQVKFLFPNPNAIDQIGGDVDTLYTVTGTRKARGQNRVFIQKACEIKKDGWIEYKGALNLL